MSLVKIQFLEAGSWADHPADPIFTVEAGEKKEVSPNLANVAVEAGKAIFVDLIAEAAADKAEAEAEAGPTEKAGAPEAGPKAKAEGKPKGKGKKG